MQHFFASLKPLAAAALVVGAGLANANITIYTDATDYANAVAALGATTGTDSFDDLTAGANLGSGPLVRAAGSLGYTAEVGPTSDIFYGAGSASDAWLSTNNATDTVTFGGFAPGVFAAGGNVFGSDAAGAFLRRGSVTLSATDGSGTQAVVVRFAQTTTFIGFISDESLTSVSLSAASGRFSTVWPTINDLSLAAATAPVPEPETYALMLAGLAAVGFMARRRKNG